MLSLRLLFKRRLVKEEGQIKKYLTNQKKESREIKSRWNGESIKYLRLKWKKDKKKHLNDSSKMRKSLRATTLKNDVI